MMKKLAGWALVFSVIVPVLLASTVTAADDVFSSEASCNSAPVVISELQHGAATASGSTNYRYEFVELYNCTDQPINLAGYSLIFRNTSGEEITRLALSAEIAPQNYFLAIHNSYAAYLNVETFLMPYQIIGSGNLNSLSALGGSVTLADTDDSGNEIPVDFVAYGAVSEEFLPAAPLPPSGQSVKRCTNESGLFVNTLDNSYDFLVTDPPTLSNLFIAGPTCSAPSGQEPPETAPAPICEQIILNEVLPNASGADGGKEFIELHNPTSETLPLFGCVLRLGEAGKEFALPNETLAPGAYRAFYNDETGISLPNAAGGTVWLLMSGGELKATYPPNMKDDQAWALVGGQWKATLKATPGAVNQLVLPIAAPKPKATNSGSGLKPCAANQERNPATNRCRLKTSSRPSLTSCKAGQERNPATNRCRSVLSASNALVPCQTGQTRNPATNRCRSNVSSASSLVPCRPGQERNPATNRCRSTATAASSLKPCAANQERNPATNRCRKIATAAGTLGISEVNDVAAGQAASNPRWWLAGTAIVSAAAYGAYEWRQEVRQLFGRLKNRFFPGASPK